MRILVVGGDGHETGYRAVIEGMGGSFDWHSGFGQIARVPAKVRWATSVTDLAGPSLDAAV